MLVHCCHSIQLKCIIYISQTKKHWITPDVINESYTSQYAAALRTVDTAITKTSSTEKETLQAARTKLVEFHETNLAEKHTVQRRLRATQFSGHAMVDDLITSFAKSTTSIHCMAFM
jgi:hypothetical protein